MKPVFLCQRHPNKKVQIIDRTVNDAAKIFGINSNALGYIPGENDADPKLVSVWDNLQDKKVAIDAEMFESYGTIRFMNTFPLVAQAIANGSTLVIDEFDASLHPMALMSIINVFHNDDINIHHAQLIINTHNPIFLNTKHEYKGYYYYKENPSLEIWQAIENILKDCGI